MRLKIVGLFISNRRKNTLAYMKARPKKSGFFLRLDFAQGWGVQEAMTSNNFQTIKKLKCYKTNTYRKILESLMSRAARMISVKDDVGLDK